MKKKSLIIFFILLFIPSLVLAYTNSTNWCIDANVSQHISVINANTTIENVTCPFGCNSFSGECNPNPYDVSTVSILYFMFPVISFVMLYFSSLLKKEDWPIHMLLVGTALLFITFPLGTLSESLPTSISWLYYLSIIIFFIIMFYYILKIITRSAQQLGAKA